ncbi:MAG: hypothetical protein PHG82_00600 [Candidatus Gracilibacteria bacterium]|nr:hypothetical protein [Candidatus Gracilibacteria bacterium]
MENTNDKNLNIVTPINTKESKKIDFEKLDIAGLSDYINNLSDFDVSNSEHKEIAKKFLQLMASKNAQKSTLESDEIPSHFDISERRALSKVFDLVKAFYDYKEGASIVLGYTEEKLNLLQNYIDGKEKTISQASEKLEVTKTNVKETKKVKEDSKEKREALKTQELSGSIEGTFGSKIEKGGQWKNVNKASLNSILEQKSGADLLSLYNEMNTIAKRDNLKNGKYEFGISNSSLEEVFKKNGYVADGFFGGEEMGSLFQIIEDVVLTQKEIGAKNFKDQIAIMFDSNRDGVLDQDVHFYTKEKEFFDAIKTPENWDNLLKNLGYNGKSGFDKELGNNYFSARKNFETRLATVLHQGDILLRVNPGEMLTNPNAVKERISFVKELLTKVDKTLNGDESRKQIEAKILEIKKANGDNSPATESEIKYFIDQIKLKAVGIVVGTNNGAGLSFDISKLTNDILSTLNVGFINGVWGIGVAKDFSFVDGRLQATAGIVNLIPYVGARGLMYKGDTSSKTLLGKTNIDSTYDLGLSGGASIVGGIGAIDVSKVDEKTKTGIENLKTQMSGMIDNVFVDIEAGKTFENSSFKDNLENKQAYEILASQLNSYGDKSFVKTGILNNYERELYKNADGLQFTGVILGLAAMIPFIGAKFEYHDTKWLEADTIKLPKKPKYITKQVLETLKVESKNIVTESTIMTNVELSASILALEDKFDYKTRYNKGAFDFMDPNANLETRWNGLKALDKSTKKLRESNLAQIIAGIEKSGDVNQKWYLISVLSQFTRKSNDFKNGDIAEWNNNIEKRKELEFAKLNGKKSRREKFNEILGFSLNDESTKLYTQLTEGKGKISKVNLDALSFDVISSLNVEKKSLKGLETLNAKTSILTVDGKPAWEEITDKSKIDIFIQNLAKSNSGNINSVQKKQIIEGLKNQTIVLKLCKDSYGGDDKIIPIVKATETTIMKDVQVLDLSGASENIVNVNIFNPEYKNIDGIAAYTVEKLNLGDKKSSDNNNNNGGGGSGTSHLGSATGDTSGTGGGAASGGTVGGR